MMRFEKLKTLGWAALLVTACAGSAMAQTISSFNPQTVSAGGPQFTLTVNGTGLTGTNVLAWTDPGAAGPVAIPYTASGVDTQITVTIPAARIATAGNATVAACTGSIANCGEAATFPINSSPILSSLSQTTAIAGSPAFTLVLTGVNFNTNDTVSFGGGTPLTATVNNAGTQLTTTVPAFEIANPGAISVAVLDGGSESESNFLTFTVGIQLTSLQPNSTLAGSGQSITVNVDGTGGLSSNTNFFWNGTTLLSQPGSPSATNAVVQIPAALIAAPTIGTITAVSGGQTSNGLSFTAFGPITSSIAPTFTTVGSPNVALTINGANFAVPSSSVVLFTLGSTVTMLAPSGGGGNQLTTTVPANLLTTAGTATIAVQNFTGGPISNSQPFTIYAVPVVTSATPASFPFNTATPITVNGTFNAGDQIVFNGVTLPTTGTATQLQATVPAAQLQTLGPVTVRAVNPANVQSTTSATVTVIPVISSLNPSSTPAGSAAFLLTVNVTGGFTGVGGSQISFNGTTINATFVNANQVTATIPANLLVTPAIVPVTVTYTFSVSTATSAPVSFTIGAAAGPTISSVTPNSAAVGAAGTPVTIQGANFKQDVGLGQLTIIGARVLFTPPNSNTAVQLTPSTTTAGAITVTIPQAQLAVAGTATIAVKNVTDNTTSGTLPFTIVATPVITTLFPNPTPAGQTIALGVFGSNFSNSDTILVGPPGCVVLSCLTPLNTTFNSAANVSGSLLGTTIPVPGIYNVYVETTLGALSAVSPLTVGLAITTLTPSSVTQNVTPVPSLVVHALGGLTANSVVFFNGQALTTVFDSATQVHATLTPTNVASAGTFPVTVQTGQAPASNALNFTVTPVGNITSINPSSAFAGSATLTIQVSGTNFNNKDAVRLGTTALATTFVDAQTLTAIIPAASLTNAASLPVTVVDSGSIVSNAINFQVQLHITSLAPPSVPAGGPAFNLTATLTGGVTQNTSLFYAGTQLQTVSDTATTITALVPASLITTAGTPAVFAVDGSNQSNTVNHLVLGSLTLTSISPNFVDAGTNGLQLILTGTGFNSGSVASVNGVSVPTQSTNLGLLAQVPASALTTPGTAQVLVTNSGQQSSNALPLTILAPLSVTSLSPSIIGAGSPQFTLTVNGTGFDPSTIVTWGAGGAVIDLTTTFVSGTQLNAIVPAALVAQVGTANVGVTDTRGRFVANTLPFSIVAPLMITNLNPSSAMVGTAVNLTITGVGFNGGQTTTPGLTAVVVHPQVLFGTTAISVTPVSDTQINVTIPATVNSVMGIIPVSVRAASGLVSNSLPFNAFLNPIITSINPSGVSIGANGSVLTVNGIYFQSGAAIVLNGATLPTTFISTTQLTAPLPSFSAAGSETVVVVNPGGFASNTVGLGVGGARSSPPTLTLISPTAVSAGGTGFTLTAMGTGFVSGAVISFGGTNLVTTFVSSGQLTGVVPSGLIAQSANVPVYVINPDGTLTNSLTLAVTGRPVIISLNPSSASVGAATFTLNVTGSGFKTGALVSFNGITLTTTFLNGGQLTASVPASMLKTAGSFPVVVTNLDGTASDPVPFAVNPFALISINPATGTAGGPAFTLTLTGTGFVSGASVSFNGSTLGTTFVNSTTLTASVSASLIATAGTAPVTVTNPDGSVAGPVTFTIQSGLTLVSINPTTLPANSKATSIAATGTGFVQGSTIVFNGAAIATTFGSSTSLTGTIPASQLVQTGPVSVTVTNPNGGTSNSLTFTVGPPLPPPVITSVTPSTASVGAAATPITIAGSGFVQGSAVQFSGGGAATTFVSATQLTAVLSASQLAQGGVFTIQVINPNGDQSNTVNFTVSTPLSITKLTPGAALQGSGDTQIAITGLGIVNGATVMFGSTSLAASVSGTTSISATIPAAQLAQPGPIAVTVKNPDGTVSNSLGFLVEPTPTISLNATITPAGTNQVTITLSAPALADLSGTLALTFVANASNAPANYIDPAAQFSSGGTSITFTIPAGQTTAILPGNGVFSPGTVAGTLTLTLTQLSSVNDNILSNPAPSKSFVIAPSAPSITVNSVKIINGTSAGFTVELTGFSTTREIKTATLTFTSSQTISGGGTSTVDVSSVFNTYFASASGTANGGTFKLDIPFTIAGGDASIVTSVSVTLTNSVGSSAPVSGGR
jgi:hypothetical protein